MVLPGGNGGLVTRLLGGYAAKDEAAAGRRL
jgi:hypothetical protein